MTAADKKLDKAVQPPLTFVADSQREALQWLISARWKYLRPRERAFVVNARHRLLFQHALSQNQAKWLDDIFRQFGGTWARPTE